MYFLALMSFRNLKYVLLPCALVLWITVTGHSRNFYPDVIGNRWTLQSLDGMNLRTVTIKGPERIDGEELRFIEEDTNGNINKLYVKSEADGIKLVRSVVSIAIIGEVTFDYSPPQVFLPIPANLGTNWTIQSEAEIAVVGKVRSTNRAEVIAIEEVATPAGTFQNCLNIGQNIALNLPIADLELTNSMWLAPDIGLVKATDSGGVIFELIDFDIAESDPQTAVQSNGKLTTTWASMKYR
ncbi:MAG: hypothetical protein OXN17_07455 [Candidatus Poribacteria bacterium]|nr:hypothetical protein [Candidatus Poribacteria bacterium]MDE0502723.1 hypothetical protein [Candidatus Poribacteria bacterium]